MAQQGQMNASPAARRLHQIVASTVPRPVCGGNHLATLSCSASNVVDLEGQAISRFTAPKIVLLQGSRGVPLGPSEKVEHVFSQRGLQLEIVTSVDQIPADTEVIVTTGATVGSEVLAKAPRLKLVTVALTGTDNVDINACKRRGIVVTNVPAYSTDATAELVIAQVISLLRRLPQCNKLVSDGSWACPPQDDLQNKTVGIVGVGQIGLRLAELFKAFKVKRILGFPERGEPQFSSHSGMYMDSLAGLFLEADIICICTPLNNQTQGLISGKLMQLLRQDSILVNVSRGEVVDESALAEMLQQGRFRAAIDNFSVEPLPAHSPLRSVPSESLLMTPHIGYQSVSSLEKRLDITIKNILAFLAGQAFNSVSGI